VSIVVNKLTLPPHTNRKPKTMADVHDKKTRSYNMSRIKGWDTRPEMVEGGFTLNDLFPNFTPS
jgi:hypothetical protein